MRKLVIVLAVVLFAGVVAVSVMVEVEGENLHENLGGGGKGRALVLFHPSRDAHFSDDLSMALSEGLKAAGLAVENLGGPRT
jgi:hypothetical protein